MSENEFGIVLLLVGAAGGAWGARSSGTQAWRGAVVIALSMLVTLAIFVALAVDNQYLAAACNLALVAIIGGALKMTPRQIATATMGALILAVVGGLIAGLTNTKLTG
ncbi:MULTISPECIES: hypothetical protein [unclassified Rhizobium]|uniref:hypothetical protein n=1 Tax=unclassified Rhizobium TaxID=2613769 RepID=UPI003827876A